MAKGTVLAELVLDGDKSFRSAIDESGDKMDGAARDAGALSGAVSYAGDALSEMSRDTLGLTGSLFALQSAADEAEDEIDSAGRSAVTSSGWFSTLAFSTDGAAVSFGTLSAVTTGLLIPSLATLATTLVPIVAALGGLAAIGGSIAGLGALAIFGAAATNTKELKTQLTQTATALESAFGPTLTMVTGAIGYLLNQFENIIPALVPAEGAVQELLGNFVNLGEAVIGVLPAFMDLATTLALEFLPPLVSMASRWLPMLPGLVRRLVGAMRDLAPTARSIGLALADLAPTALEFGQTVLAVVAPAVIDLITILDQVMGNVNGMEAGMQQLVVAGTILAPILTTIGSVLVGLSAPILGVIAAVGALALAWEQDVGRVREIVGNVSAELQRILGNRIPELVDSAADAWEAWKPILTPIFNFVTSALGVIVTTGLDGLLTGLDIVLDVLSGDFGEAWRTYTRLAKRNISRVAEFINKFSSGALEDLLNTLITVYNTVGKVAERTNVFGEDFTFTAMKQVDIGTTPFSPGKSPTPAGTGGSASKPGRFPGSGGSANGPQAVRVTGELTTKDGEVVAKIDDRIEKKNEMMAKKAGYQ